MYNPNKHHRRSIRLKGYDYSQEGLYFVTICTQKRLCLFGKVVDKQMIANPAGEMVLQEWANLKQRFPQIELHEYVVMPNHFHAIVEIRHVGNRRGNPCGCPNNVDDRDCPNIDNDDNGYPNNGDNPSDKGHQQGVPQRKTGYPQGVPQQSPQRDAPNNDTVIHHPTLGEILGAFQSIVTVNYIRAVRQNGWMPFDGKLWQRNYWEHIIRNEESYYNITQYIANNPTKWDEDKLHTT